MEFYKKFMQWLEEQDQTILVNIIKDMDEICIDMNITTLFDYTFAGWIVDNLTEDNIDDAVKTIMNNFSHVEEPRMLFDTDIQLDNEEEIKKFLLTKLKENGKQSNSDKE